MSIEIINSTSQTIESAGKLSLGNINIRRCDGSVVFNGTDSITFRGNGIYQVFVKVDATSTVASQTLKIAISYDNTTSSIASASASTGDTAGETHSLTIPKKIKICGSSLVINLVNSGSSSTIYENLIIDIVKE